MKVALRLFLVFHVAILVLGLVPSRKMSPGFVRYFLAPYARLTVAGSSFGFFSPNVGNQLTVNFEVDTKDGAKSLPLSDLVPQEVAVRLGNMYRLVGQVYQNKKLRRSVIASLTTPIFETRADIQSVNVKVNLYEVPKLGDWNRGEKISDRTVYKARFERALQ